MDRGSYRILLVDDERLVRFITSSYLMKAGYAVVQAESPEAAMVCFHQMSFDLIITDVAMGGIDGFAFRDMVRQVDSRVPIVFYTTVVNDYGNWLLDRLSEDMRSYYVGKGVSREILLARLRKIIDARQFENDAETFRKDINANLEMAAFVQNSLLPPWTGANRVYHYGIAWNPYEKVSGDLHEWIRIDDTHVILIAGDVSGHGIRSALAMSAIQSYIKRFQNGAVAEPEARILHIASRLHRFISENFMDVVYMAGLVMYVDFENKRICYLNAGLPEPKCVRGKSGESLAMNPEGRGALPFGLIGDSSYGAADLVAFDFPDDAVFILSSDGVTDISSDEGGDDIVPQELFDKVCSIAVSSDYASGTVVQTAATIVKSLSELGFSHAQDDRMLIVFSKAQNRTDKIIHEVRIVPESIDLASETLGSFAAELTGDREISAKVQLLLDEFLINVYRHGLAAGDHRSEYGIVAESVVGDQLVVTVLDGGRNWEGLSSMSLEDTQRRLDEHNRTLADSGRGLAIMRIIANGGVSHEWISGLNRTVFRIPIKGART